MISLIEARTYLVMLELGDSWEHHVQGVAGQIMNGIRYNTSKLQCPDL